MNSERFQRVAAIFERAIVVQDAERNALLERECGPDQNLRDEVESLLARHRPGQSGHLEAVHRTIVDEPEPASAAVPETIGRYQVRRVIASGAMGTVYEAVQDDPHRVVALKVLRHGVTSPSMLKRFRHEAEFLARLKHPNIAQVYDAATHDEGGGAQPYFAMELVEGRPLTEHVRAARLRVRERLELLVKICDAVQHAHGRGIIHRDLKPDNILVDERGEPRILDFGIARATDADLRVTTIETGVAMLVGTIPYMSPEQVAGNGEPDWRSDVYALGVILYELLGDKLPHDLHGKSIPEAARIIREDDPSSLGAVSRVFRGDLETIVAKALEKDPERRYQSAADLAADLRRHLRNEPIVARPASTFYQLRKFARRNPTLVGGVAACFVLLLAGTIGIGWQLQATKRAAAQALALGDYFETMLNLLSPINSSASSNSALPTSEALLLELASQLETRLEDWPKKRADLHLRFGMTFWGIGRFDDAHEHFDRTCEIRTDHLGADHKDTYLARMWRCQFWGSVGTSMFDIEREFAAIAAGLEEQLGPRARDTLAAKLSLYNTRRFTGQAQQAIEGIRDVRKTAREVLDPDDRLVLKAESDLGWELVNTGKFTEAEELLTDAVERSRTALAERDMVRRGLVQILATLMNRQERYAAALECAREAVDLGRLGEKPDLTTIDIRASNELARAYLGLDQPENAEEVVRRRAKECKDHLGDHRYTLWAIERVGWCLQRQEKHDDAVVELRDALQKIAPALDADVQVGFVRARLAPSLEKVGELEDAERQWRLALEAVERLGLIDYVLGVHGDLAHFLKRQDRLDHAEQAWRDRRRTMAEVYPNDRRANAVAARDLAWFLKDQDAQKRAEAEELVNEAIDGFEVVFGPRHSETLWSRRAHGVIVYRRGRTEEAEQLLAEVIVDADVEFGQGQRLPALTRVDLARWLMDLDRYVEAERLLLETHPRTDVGARELLHTLYIAMGQPEDAERYRDPTDPAQPPVASE